MKKQRPNQTKSDLPNFFLESGFMQVLCEKHTALPFYVYEENFQHIHPAR